MKKCVFAKNSFKLARNFSSSIFDSFGLGSSCCMNFLFD